MKKSLRLLFFAIAMLACTMLLLCITNVTSFAQPSVTDAACAICGRSSSQIAASGHETWCKYYVAPSSSSTTTSSAGSSNTITADEAKLLLLKAVINLVATSSAAADAAAKKAEAEKLAAEKLEQERKAAFLAEQQRLKAARDLAAYNQLIQMSKTLPEGNASLDFKTLDGDAENLRKQADDQFSPKTVETTAVVVDSDAVYNSFFNDTLPNPVIQTVETVLYPDSDKIYQDASTAVNLVEAYKKDKKLTVELLEKVIPKAGPVPIAEQLTCEKLKFKINRDSINLEKFNAINIKTKNYLNEWQEINKKAITDAAYDGAEIIFGQFCDKLFAELKKRKENALVIKNLAEKLSQSTTDPKITAMLSGKILAADKRIAFYDVAIKKPDFLNKGYSIEMFYNEISSYYEIARNSLQLMEDNIRGTDSDYKELVRVLTESGELSKDYKEETSLFLVMQLAEVVAAPEIVGYAKFAQMGVTAVCDFTNIWKSRENIITLQDADGKALGATCNLISDIEGYKKQLATNNCQ